MSGNGWHYLTATTAPNPPTTTTDAIDDIDRYLLLMRAVGYAEGALTCLEMRDFYANFYSGLFDGGDPSDNTLQFIR